MKAAILYEPKRELKIEDVERPTPRFREVLVKVEASGICHSDIHIWEGYWGPLTIKERGIKLPLIMGHEIAGIVEEVGSEVTEFKKGDRVAVYPWIGDGICINCISGNENLCVKPRSLGIFTNGGFAEYVLVPSEKYLVPFEGVDSASASLMSCAGITAYNAVLKSNIRPDEVLVIMGIGGLGHIALQVAKNLFKPTLIAVDIRDSSLKMAEELGADYVINSSKKDVVEEIKKVTRGLGARAVIDFVNTAETSLTGFNSLMRGGRLVLVGLMGDYARFILPMIPLRAVEIVGSYTGNLKSFFEVIELLKRGIIKPRLETMNFLEINEAIQRLRRGEVSGRLVLTW